MNPDQDKALLRVDGLKTYFPVRGGVLLTAKAQCKAVDDISLEIGAGETLGLVGESGCGKTSIAVCLLRLLPDNAQIKGGHIHFDGVDLVALPEDQMRTYRWNRISMVFQAAMNALNPVYTVEDQILEAIP